MGVNNAFAKASALSFLLIASPVSSYAFDSASLELGSGDKTKMIRIGAQWQWEKRWWHSNGTHISGYWDLTLARWRGTRFQNIPESVQNLTAIGLTPVFRFQNDSLRGFYVEGGIGAYWLSELYDNNNKRLSTRYQFGDHLGFGYVFPNSVDVNMKFQHFSNGSFKKPNDGVNFGIIRISYSF